MIVEPQDNTIATEPSQGEISACLNCGQALVGPYCHNCGQSIGEHNHGLWQFVAEFLEEFIRLDSKFLRTLVPLLFKPGRLTQEWVLGKRVRFISPLKLYISLSALCFLVISLTSHPGIVNFDSKDEQALSTARSATAEKAEKSKSGFDKLISRPFEKLTVGGAEGAANIKEFEERFMGRLSTANLILLPIFALLFKILYIRRSKYYVEHLVFALHYYAFFSVGTTLIILISQVKPIEFLNMPVVLWMLAYLPIAMFVNYRQGVFKTFFKCWIFCSVYLVAIGLVLLGMLIYTAYEIPKPKKAANSITQAAKPPAPVSH